MMAPVVVDRFSPVMTIDLVAGNQSVVGAVSCVRLSEVRRHQRVQDTSRVRIGRHVIIVPEQGSGRHVVENEVYELEPGLVCLLYTSPSPRDATLSRMPSSA